MGALRVATTKPAPVDFDRLDFVSGYAVSGSVHASPWIALPRMARYVTATAARNPMIRRYHIQAAESCMCFVLRSVALAASPGITRKASPICS